jgi:zinc protease
MKRPLKTLFFLVIAALLSATMLIAPAQAQREALPQAERMTLPNGLVLLFRPDRSLPILTMEILIDAGPLFDPPGKEGLSYLTAATLLRGSLTRKAEAMDREIDFMGTLLSFSSGHEYAAASFRCLKRHLDRSLDILLDALREPSFPETEVSRVKERTLAAIHSREDNPGEAADEAFMKNLFPASRYGTPVEGTLESVARITRNDLVSFHRTYYRPNGAILAVTGDMTLQEMKERVAQRFEKWSSHTVAGRKPDLEVAKEHKEVTIRKAITQANIVLGHQGITRGDPDYYAVTVMNYILGGGGFSSRLMEEIRNKRGLAYSVMSHFDARKHYNDFQITLQTKNASAREAIDTSLAEMKRIQEEPVSEEELEAARKYLVGSFPLRLDSQAKIATFLLQVEYFGLGLDYQARYPSIINSITREEVLRVARKYLHPDRVLVVIVGNQEEVSPKQKAAE